MKRFAIILLLVLGLCVGFVIAREIASWNVTVYSTTVTPDPNSPTPTASNSGVTAFSSSVGMLFSSDAHYGMGFRISGTISDPNNDITTSDSTLIFYADSSASIPLCTITFDQLDPNTTTDVEAWPGDCSTVFDGSNAGYEIPVPPYFKFTWSVALDPNAVDPNLVSYALTLTGDFRRGE